MSKEARGKGPSVSAAVAKKMTELAELIALEQFGEQGVPIDITFSEIEEIGHQAGQAMATEIDHQLIADHESHFADKQACPQCGEPCASKHGERELTTRDGPMELPEATCHCPRCRRDFFPSAGSVEA